MKQGIQQTAEAVSFLAGLAADIRKAYRDDSKISAPEIAGILWKNMVEGVAAVKGVAEIPGELADLSMEEMDFLHGTLLHRLEIQDRSNARDLTNLHLDAVKFLVCYIRDLRNFQLAIPKPEVIPESTNDDIGGAEFPSPTQ